MQRLIRRAARVAAAAVHPRALAYVASRSRALSIDQHLQAAVDWLLEANARVPDRMGFSIGYFLDEGAWQPAYVETTGYIIPTLLRLTRHAAYRRAEVDEACAQSARWLVNVQFRDGSYGNSVHTMPTVFDTGQVIFGLLAASHRWKDPQFLDAADRAGRWLCQVQEADGAWRRFAYGGRAHSYYAEVAWSLLRLWRATGSARYLTAAERHLIWVLADQAPNGFFRSASFDDRPAILHTIGYALQGVLESGLLLEHDALIAAARRAADALIEASARDGILRGNYDERWDAASRFRCLTGLAQVALVWVRLYQRVGADVYRDHAARVANYLERRQILAPHASEVHGGLFASSPVWGRYFPFRLPNWTMKFFVDLLLFGYRPPSAEWTLSPAAASPAIVAVGAQP